MRKNKIERLKSLYSLCIVRDILLNEKNRSYYRNLINKREEFDVGEDILVNDEYAFVPRMVIYENGFYDFYIARKSSNLVKTLKK